MIRWFAGHPTAANLLLILILAVGALAAPTLTRETFPDYLPPEVGIQMEYRGAAAADVEEAICQRLGEALARVEFMDEFRCTARDNLAEALAAMDPRGNMGRFLDDIRTEIEALTDLPERAEAPIIRELHRTDLVAALAVAGDMRLPDLETYAGQLEDRLLALPDVVDVVSRGLSQLQWQIEVPRDRLRQYGLGVEDIAAAVRRQNVDLPLGVLETEARDIQLRFVDQRRRPQELAELVVIAGPAGGELRLGEIATITETYERAEEQVRFNGERALVLEVHKARYADALDVMDRLRAFVAGERGRQGEGVRLTLTQDMTSIVRDRLQMLVENGLLGLVLVGLVLSLFFRPRLALWALFGLPAAFAGAFAVMALTGLSLNMITLVGLLMAIGIVMDDAVVITDNIARHAGEGRTPLEAVVAGAREVLPGVLSSFLTTAAVFVPLSFLAGELGSVLEVLPVVLIAALLASLVEAFWILPHHLKGGVAALTAGHDSRLRARFAAAFERFRDRIGILADGGVKYRYAVLAVMLAVLLGSAGFIAGGHVKMEAMPEIDGDVLEARILMPQGTPLARTEAVVERVTVAAESLDAELSPQQPGGAALVRAVQTRFSHNPSAGETGPHVATVMLDLLSTENRSTDLDTLSRRWREAIGDIPGLISLVIQEPGFGPAGIPIELRLYGEDLDRLKQAADALAVKLAGYRGVSNVLDDLRPGKPQRWLVLAEGALPLGLTAADVAGQLRTGILGEIVDTVQVGDQHIEILVRQSGAERATLDFLRDAVILDGQGNAVPLGEVVEIRAARDWAQITRIDGRRTVTVSADVDGRRANADAIVTDLSQSWLPELLARYPGVEVGIEGQAARSRETGQSIARGLLLGLLGIFLILSFQFRSYLEPLIVMLSIPLAFMGAIWGHVLMGYNLSMPSLVGAASLAGIVVNNAILLVMFIKQYRAEGMEVRAAAGRASRERTRAIFITSSTTIAGLLPLLAETSTQATAIIPLVIAVVFGLLVSTVLILIALPALYVILDDLGIARPPSAQDG
ncbi:cation/multidrug efflux pump [Thiohalobacter thiocyanaticus]|uniref:Cation/multidrug efflux pump n=1 Tax=Thiohalobacter thiocyanaticus TaxID=585455 RepID=A0A1Z4VUJ4_9GAMM|nr:efflux RND transporter permease subunit [Thiohalobacter thiocyanaticus]BAZ95183.1 cation/multidrug efflux pump [Thiohalobacter thiocyanaticus]